MGSKTRTRTFDEGRRQAELLCGIEGVRLLLVIMMVLMLLLLLRLFFFFFFSIFMECRCCHLRACGTRCTCVVWMNLIRSRGSDASQSHAHGG